MCSNPIIAQARWLPLLHPVHKCMNVIIGKEVSAITTQESHTTYFKKIRECIFSGMIGGLGIAVRQYTPSLKHLQLTILLLKNTTYFNYLSKYAFVKLFKHEVIIPETGCSAKFGYNQSTRTIRVCMSLAWKYKCCYHDMVYIISVTEIEVSTHVMDAICYTARKNDLQSPLFEPSTPTFQVSRVIANH